MRIAVAISVLGLLAMTHACAGDPEEATTLEGTDTWEATDESDGADALGGEDLPAPLAREEALHSTDGAPLGKVAGDLGSSQQNNFRAVTSVSCSNCHAAGFVPIVK